MVDNYRTLDVSEGEQYITLEVTSESPPSDREHYTGTYEVTPLITTQVLPTNSKIMDNNVTIWMIPTREEQNPQGGTTLIIG